MRNRHKLLTKNRVEPTPTSKMFHMRFISLTRTHMTRLLVQNCMQWVPHPMGKLVHLITLWCFFLDFGQKTGKPHTDPDWSIILPLFVSLTSPFSVHSGALPTFRKQISPNLSSSNWSSHYPRHAIHSPENMKLFMLFHFSGGSIFGLMSWWERQEVKNEEHHLHFPLWDFFCGAQQFRL